MTSYDLFIILDNFSAEGCPTLALNLIQEFKLYKYFKNIENTLYLKTPNVIIEENLFIPKGFNVQINQNENIILKNNAFIISESPWKIEGSKENPVNISGTPDNFGGGIFISDNSNPGLEFC